MKISRQEYESMVLSAVAGGARFYWADKDVFKAGCETPYTWYCDLVNICTQHAVHVDRTITTAGKGGWYPSHWSGDTP
jgi:hypothetical protein